jgi:hypothetical protein
VVPCARFWASPHWGHAQITPWENRRRSQQLVFWRSSRPSLSCLCFASIFPTAWLPRQRPGSRPLNWPMIVSGAKSRLIYRKDLMHASASSSHILHKTPYRRRALQLQKPSALLVCFFEERRTQAKFCLRVCSETHVVFTCGHSWSMVEFESRILVDFGTRLKVCEAFGFIIFNFFVMHPRHCPTQCPSAHRCCRRVTFKSRCPLRVRHACSRCCAPNRFFLYFFTGLFDTIMQEAAGADSIPPWQAFH